MNKYYMKHNFFSGLLTNLSFFTAGYMHCDLDVPLIINHNSKLERQIKRISHLTKLFLVEFTH